MKRIVSVLLIAIVLVSAITVSATSAGAASLFSTPYITSLENTNSGIRVEWTNFINAPRYRLFVKYNGSGWKKVRDVSGTMVIDTSNHTSGTVYTYTVRAIDGDGTYLSDYEHNGASIMYVAPPTIKSLSSENNYIHVTWNSVKGAKGYRLYARVLEEDWVKLTDTTSTSFNHFFPISGATIAYTVRALDSRGNLVSGTDLSVKSIKYVAPPTITKVENKTNGALITWKSVDGASKYRVYYRTLGGTWRRIGDTTSTSITHRGVVDNQKYEYTVRCISPDGSRFESTFKTGCSNVYHSTPVIHRATLQNTTSAVVYFKKITGVNRYRVFIKNGASWKGVGDTTSNRMTADLSICDNYAFSYGTSGVKRVAYTVRGLSDDGKKYITDYDKLGFEFYRDTATRRWKPTTK